MKESGPYMKEALRAASLMAIQASLGSYPITNPIGRYMDEAVKLKHEPKANLTNKQRKARAASKRARKARKINRR